MQNWLALCLLIALPALAQTALAQSSAVGEPKRDTIEVQGQKIEVLSHPWEGPKHYGAALLLPSLGQPADAPGLMAYLREQLPLYGLATFSVAAPEQPAAINYTTKAEDVSRAGDGSVADKGQAPTKSRTDEEWQALRKQQRQMIVDSINQTVPLMQAYTGGWVLVTENQTAALVMEMIAQQQLSRPNLLVVVNPYSADPKHNRELANQYGLFSMPVLDLQTPDGAPASLSTAAQRQLKISSLEAKHSRQHLLALNLSQASAYAECLNVIKGMSVASLR